MIRHNENNELPTRSHSEQATADRPSAKGFRIDRPSGDVLLALLVGLASLALYIVTAAPTVATIFDDSLEFQVVLPTLGIAHPSGYPLFTLVGKLATDLIPFRDPAGRANLFSALAAAAAISFLYLVARRIGGSRLAAAVATIAFAISPIWWSQATLAEVYAPHGLLMILFLYLLLRWEEDLLQGIRRSDGWLAGAALVSGLGLAHHRMIALLFPAALVFVLWTDPSLLRQPRRWWLPIAMLLAPLFFYLYLPVRGQATTSLDGTYSPTLRGTLDWILARGYSIFLIGNPFGVSRGAGDFIALFLDQLGVFLLLAALLGLATGWRLNPRRYVFLLLATIPTLTFGAAYKVQDVGVFFIPAFLLVSLWAAWGLTPVFDTIAIYAASTARRLHLPLWTRPFVLGVPAVLLVAVILFEPIRQAIESLDRQDRSQAWGVYDYGQDIIDHVAPGGRVVGLLGETTLVRYFRDVLGQRPDIQVSPADAETARYAAVEDALARGEPVYLTRELPGSAARYSLDAAGPLIAVSSRASPASASPGQSVGAGILLANIEPELRSTHAGPIVRLNVTWAPTTPITEELKVSARLLSSSGQVVSMNDQVPVHFAYPTTAWVPGESIRDVYDLAIPPGAAGGPFGLLLVLYRAADESEVGRVELPSYFHRP